MSSPGYSFGNLGLELHDVLNAESLKIEGMGLKLHCSCNFSTTLLKNKYNAGAVVFTRDTQISRKRKLLKFVSSSGFDQLLVPMDRLLEQNNREYMRNTMMRQEAIFKEQVRELHRLYQVQKILTAELKSKEMETARSTSETSHTTPQLNSEHNYLHQYRTVSEESSLHKGFDLEWPNEESIELSLSIGCSSSNKKAKHWIHTEPTSESKPLLLSNKGSRPERGVECSERESKVQRPPPWLFQALSLNRT